MATASRPARVAPSLAWVDMPWMTAAKNVASAAVGLLVAFLASGDARWVTGTTVDATGGSDL
ncbi:hypothetical protein [Microbispora hainanensis]|uniref:hypothetical protein n=1 Tax=Microbispora hainanensis TaxID=568844 RepID=UPI001ABFCC90|nr:hypothetical protein [Microbispora hainanensis]